MTAGRLRVASIGRSWHGAQRHDAGICRPGVSPKFAAVDRQRAVDASKTLSIARRYEHRKTLVRDRAQQRKDRVTLQDANPVGGLIDYKQLGSDDQRSRYRHANALGSVKLVALQPTAALSANATEHVLRAMSCLPRQHLLSE
jgi:hypothetical protein